MERARALAGGVRQFFRDLCTVYSTRFVLLLFVLNTCCKGMLYVIANMGMLPLFKAQGASASQLQMYSAIASSPWAMKPLFGVVSDLVPLGQYNKRYWMLSSCAVGLFGTFMLVLQLRDASFTVFFFFCMHMELAVLDLLSEGKYAE